MMSKLPRYVTLKKGRYVYRPYLGKDEATGKYIRAKEISLKRNGKLIRESDPMSWVWQAYEELVGEPSDNLKWLVKKYLDSVVFQNLSPYTRQAYKESFNVLRGLTLKNGASFLTVAYEAVTPGVITKLKDKLSDRPTTANHAIEFLGAVYSWGFGRDMCKRVPTRGIKKYGTDDKKRAAKRAKIYVEDSDFNLALEVAKERQSYLYPAILLTYCCRARISEISRMQRVDGEWVYSGIKESDILDEGVKVRRGKGSLDEVTLWSDLLREGYTAALKYSKTQDLKAKITRIDHDRYILRDKDGLPIKKNSFDSAWQRLIKECVKRNSHFKRFSIHDLKAKGIDDHIDQDGGHKTAKGKKPYLRKTKRTDSTK